MNYPVKEQSFKSQYEYLKNLKSNVGSLFSEIIQQFTTINKQIDDFFTMIRPYIIYFYTTDEAIADTFLHDVIFSTKDEINGYIETIVKYMIADKETNKEVEEAINKTLTLSNSVEMILDAVEAIDLYAKNTMIIAIKAGEEGTTLTTIAVEMSHLADMVNAVSSEFQKIIEQLHSLRTKFSETCMTVDVIVENYLTQLQVRLNNTINDIIRHQKNLSLNVNSIKNFADQIKAVIQKILMEFQIEDIVRQDIEKILFAIEALEELINTDEKEQDILLWGVYRKLLSLHNDFVHLLDSTVRGINFTKESIVQINNDYNKNAMNVYDGEEFAIEKVYNSLEYLQNETIKYIDDILMRKKYLLDISKDVLIQLEKFQEFFRRIQDVVRKFDIVNMLTRIELARHRELQKTIASSLSDISIMPKKIKMIVEESENLYKDVISTMESTYQLYQQAMSIQDEILKNCVNNLKKVSLELYESKKYYVDISQQIERNIHSLQQVLDEKSEQIMIFHEIGKRLKFLCDSMEDIGILKETPELSSIDKIIESINANYGNDYKGLMLISLLKEYSTLQSEDTVIVFK